MLVWSQTHKQLYKLARVACEELNSQLVHPCSPTLLITRNIHLSNWSRFNLMYILTCFYHIQYTSTVYQDYFAQTFCVGTMIHDASCFLEYKTGSCTLFTQSSNSQVRASIVVTMASLEEDNEGFYGSSIQCCFGWSFNKEVVLTGNCAITPLMYVINSNWSIEMVKLLIDHNVKTNTKGNEIIRLCSRVGESFALRRCLCWCFTLWAVYSKIYVLY